LNSARLALTNNPTVVTNGGNAWMIARHLLERYGTRTLGVEHESDGIGPGFDGGQRIFYAGNPADLAANG
jgi:hypothetical protein